MFHPVTGNSPERRRWRRVAGSVPAREFGRPSIGHPRELVDVGPVRAAGHGHDLGGWRGRAAASVGRGAVRLARTAVRGAPPQLVSSSRRQKERQGELSLPLLTYSALGALRQDPGHGAESSADATTCGNGSTTCVLLSTYGGRGDVDPVVGGGGSAGLRGRGAGVSVAGLAERQAAREGRQSEMRTCSTRGSTEFEAPVIRPTSAVRRSTAVPEVSQ